MSYTHVIEQIENLPHYRDFKCPVCEHQQRTHILHIETRCENCQENLKLRGLASIGSEIEDVIDSVLMWLGTNRDLELAMKWKEILDQSDASDER